MGPIKPELKFSQIVPLSDRIKYFFSKTAKSYFDKPLYYLLYTGLFCLLLLLTLSRRPLPEFYIFLGILIIIEVFQKTKVKNN